MHTPWRGMAVAGLLGAALAFQAAPGGATTGKSGEFIVKCPLASTAAIPVDPILDRTGPSEHNHIFLGNTNIEPAGALALASGDFTHLSDTALQPPGPGQTTCADAMDGSAQWFPELFYNGAQRVADAG